MHQPHTHHYGSPASAGFTLMEILISISVFVILAGAATTIVVTFLASASLNETASQIAQTMRIARERSLAGLNNPGGTVRSYGVYFDGPQKRYVLYQGASYLTRNVPFDVVTDIGNSLTLAPPFGQTWDVNFAQGSGNTTASGRITLTYMLGGSRTIDVNEFGVVLQGGVGSSSGPPILLITSAANPFSRYYGEILLTEGMNEFVVSDINDMSAATLALYDVVILGEMPPLALTPEKVAMLTDWVASGGNLIAMRPDHTNAQLMALVGLTQTGSTLSDKYLLVDIGVSSPGFGIVGQTIQYHSTADLYTLNAGTVSVATLYSSATLGTSNPAVTLRPVGAQGGDAAAFTYDLAKSVVYTRQGNPAMSGLNNDSDSLIRMNDLFFMDDRVTNWLDTSKAAIPQADEQQRLLANLILRMNADKKPLPRFWYFPRDEKAVVIMTGDDHAHGGTAGRFDRYLTLSVPGCNVANWECIRSTSYIYPPTPNLNDLQAASYVGQGFEVALHVDIGCPAPLAAWTLPDPSLDGSYTTQINTLRNNYPSLGALAPVTERSHCGPYFDYDTQPQVQKSHGIRFDTNYYFWGPGNNGIPNFGGPGVFTGSGMPMRFAKADGTIIDVYQAPTQMVDESNQPYPATVNTILDNATGSNGYYGFFVVNAHTDYNNAGSLALITSENVVASAVAHGVPVVSSAQALDWIDGRNNSSFSGISWAGTTLAFTVAADSKANGLRAMVPYTFGVNNVAEVKRNGITVTQSIPETIKGITYAIFPVSSGNYTVAYQDVPPTRFNGQPSGGLAFGTTQVTLSLSTSENATCKYATVPGPSTNAQAYYDAMPNTFTTTGGISHAEVKTVSGGTNYNFYVRCRDTMGNVNTDDFAISFSVSPDPALVAYWHFDEGTGPSAFDSSGYGNTGAISNAQWTFGHSGGGLQFDGVVSVNSPPTLNLPGNMSFFAWANFGDVLGGQWGRYIIGQCDAGTVLGQYGMTVGRADDFILHPLGIPELNVGWGSTAAAFSNVNLQAGQWYFIGFTRSGSSGNWTVNLYAANSAMGFTNRTVTGITGNPGSWKPTSIGRCGALSNFYLNGVLDEVRIYNRALSPAEVQNLYNGL